MIAKTLVSRYQSGLFYDKCAERAPSPVATPELGRGLWDRSEAWAAA